MVASDIDHTQDLISETLDAFRNSPPAATYQASPEEISPGLRAERFQPDQILRNIEDALQREFFRSQIADSLRKAVNEEPLTAEDCKTITPLSLPHTTEQERAQLLNSLLSGNKTSEHVTAIAHLLTQDHYGSALTPQRAAIFFEELTKHSLDSFKVLLSLSPSDRQATILFDAWLDTQLNEVIQGLPAGEVKIHLLDPDLSVREKLEVLEYVSSPERLAFARDLLGFHPIDKQFGSFITDKLDNTLNHLTVSDRAALIDEAIQSGRDELVIHILRASNSMSELTQTVDSIGVNTLLTLHQKPVTEIVAQALLVPEIQTVSFAIPGELSTAEQCEVAYNNYLQKLQEVIDCLEQYPQVAGTDIAGNYFATCINNMVEIESEIEFARGTPTSFMECLQRHYAMAALEFRYGVDISSIDSVTPLLDDSTAEVCDLGEFGVEDTTTEKKAESPRVPHWQPQHIEQIGRVLAAMPEAELFFTPLLNRIELVEDLGKSVLGRRMVNGVIQIADLTLDHEGMRKAYDGEDPLAIVLAHEIGHGIQIGDGRSGIYYPRDGRTPYFGEGEEIHDFDEWMKLSDWTVYSRDRYELADDWGYILLDGEKLELGNPVQFHGETVVLSFDLFNNVLYSYNAESDFSNRWYAKTSPWEDFAEAFCEYLFLPDRLIEDAPEKFRHLDLEFQRYAENSKIQELLKERMQR